MAKYENPDQLLLPGMGAGSAAMREAEDWKLQHPEAYEFMCENALEDARSGRCSAKLLVELARRAYKIRISNNLTPALARLIARDYPQTKSAFHFQPARADQLDRAGGEVQWEGNLFRYVC